MGGAVGVTPAKPQTSGSNPTATTAGATAGSSGAAATESKAAAPKVFLPSTVKPKAESKVNADTSEQSPEPTGYSLQGDAQSSTSSLPQSQCPDMSEIARLRAARFEKSKEEQS